MKFYATCLVEITILVLLLNALHKGNTYTLWKLSLLWKFMLLWNLGNVGIKTGFANWRYQFMVSEQASHQWCIVPYSFLNDGRWSHTKVCLMLPIFWEWNYIENVLKYFFYGMVLSEELYLNSWGKRKNKCPPYLGHYSCDLNLAMPLEVLLFWFAWYRALAGIVSKWKENPEMIVGIIGNTYGLLSRNHRLFIIAWWSKSMLLERGSP